MLKRNILQPDRYQYLTKEQSDIYDKAKAGEYSKDQGCKIIVELLEKIAAQSEGAHRASRY